jgi:hypothetical protein
MSSNVSYHNPAPQTLAPELAFIYTPRPGDEGPLGYAMAEYRGFKLRREREYFLWEVYQAVDSTNVPERLRSKFSNIKIAQSAIDKFLKELELKEKTRDEKKSKY